MPQKLVKTLYLGRYQSQTENALDNSSIVAEQLRYRRSGKPYLK